MNKYYNLFEFFFLILQSLNFHNYYFLLPILLNVLFCWLFFLKLNITNNELSLNKNNKFLKLNTIKHNSYLVYINYLIILILNSFFVCWLFKGVETSLFYNTIIINNYNLKIFNFFCIIQTILYLVLKSITQNKINYSNDFFFSLTILLYLIPYIYFVNNLFVFIFYLELISCTIFYKLIASRLWYKDIKNIKNKISTSNNLTRKLPKHYINMVFFQYWVTFFSTILLLFGLFSMLYLTGSVDWYFYGYLVSSDKNLNNFVNEFFIKIIANILLLSILFKMGVAPLHLFKIEVYKGIPFLSIMFYTTYYFIVFFLFFYILLNNYLVVLFDFWINALMISIIIGLIYIISLFFDVNFIKAFFAYSTIINSLSFLILIVFNFF